MKFTVDTLPDIADLTEQSIALILYPETQDDGTIESDPIITEVSMNVPDSGVSITFDVSDRSASISGMYVDQYDQIIKWTRGQIERDASGDPILDGAGQYIEDPLQDPLVEEATGWGDVPPSPFEVNYDRNLLWYLFQFLPPADTSDKIVTYTVSGTMTTLAPAEDPPSVPPGPDPEPVTGVPFAASISQTVFYDVDSNEANFRRYFPRGGGSPTYDDFWPPGNRPTTPGFPYILPLTLGD
ncbi:hypothetical protein VPHD148_0290 [Vibrio phage D148]